MSGETARIEIPPKAEYSGPVVDFVLSYAARISGGSNKAERLRAALVPALGMVVDVNAAGASEEKVALEVGESGGKLQVAIINRGSPILLRGGREGIHGAYFAKFQEASKHADSLSLENSGRKGQVLVLTMRLDMGSRQAALADAAPAKGRRTSIPEGETMTLRMLEQGEEGSLCRLFHLVYGYDYINEIVYYPEKLKALLDSGELLSIVAARPNGRLVGHVGLLRRQQDPPVYEACMGAVDPAIKSRGLFGKLFTKTMEAVRKTPMSYCLCDLVTNHDFSQRHVAKFGGFELALFAGSQTRETQARLQRLGLGPDPEDMDRYSILVSVIPQVPRPFGEKVALPENIGERFGFLLKPLDLAWSPTPRFQTLPAGGTFKTVFERSQSAVLFDMEQPGRQAADDVIDSWSSLLREGFEYAGVDVPLDARGLGTLYDLLSGAGFFAAGFVPYRGSTRLGFRFQALGPTKVAFDKIRAATERGKKLLAAVRGDYEATRLL